MTADNDAYPHPPAIADVLAAIRDGLTSAQEVDGYCIDPGWWVESWSDREQVITNGRDRFYMQVGVSLSMASLTGPSEQDSPSTEDTP